MKEVELKKKENKKKEARIKQLIKKKKIELAKEDELEKKVDPELKYFLNNKNNSENLLDTLLKGVPGF